MYVTVHQKKKSIKQRKVVTWVARLNQRSPEPKSNRQSISNNCLFDTKRDSIVLKIDKLQLPQIIQYQ